MATSTQNPDGTFTLAAPAAPVAPTPVTPTPVQPVAPQTPPAPVTPTATPPQTPAGGATMPNSGSIVDLLNQTGAASSYADRSQLAQKFGVQGYSGTAQQNTDLAKKYLDFYNSKKDTAAPNSNPRQEIQDGTQSTPQQQDPEQTFFDQYGSMNPAVKSLYDQINTTLSAPSTTQSFADQYKQLTGAQGIPGLNTQLMNIQNVMNGTEDDIRNEITSAGGVATESQVQAMVGARNKTLLNQANSLQSTIQLRNDYVNQVMQYSQLDRADVEKQVDQKLGLTQQLSDLQDKMVNAAKDNYQKIVDTVGYQGLADAYKGDPNGMALAEKTLGLPKGALSNPTFLSQQSGTANADFTLSPGSVRYDAKGNVIASVPSNANSATGAASSPVSDALQAAIQNGTIDPNKINSRTLGIYNSIAQAGTDAVASHAGAAGETTAIQNLTSYKSNAVKTLGVIDANMPLLEGLADKVNSTGVPGLDQILQGAKTYSGNNLDVIKYVNSLKTLRSEYAQMLSKGAVATEGDKADAAQAIPAGLSSAGYSALADQLKLEANNIIGATDAAISSAKNKGSSSGSTNDVSQLKSQLKSGEILVARENQDGTRHYVAITPDELWKTDIKQ